MVTTAARTRLRNGAAAFSPAQVAGLVFWGAADGANFQDSTRTTPAVADGDPIGSLTDMSTAGNHLSQATSTKRPLLKTGILNGKPVLRFDGVDDYLSKAFTLNQPHTAFIVAKTTGSANQYMEDGPLGNVMTISNSAGTTVTRAYAGNVIDATGSAAVMSVIAVVYNGATSKVIRSGVVTTGNIGTTNAGGIVLGSFQAGGGSYQNGDTAEAINYNLVVADSDIALIGAYLAAKYGLTWS